MIQRVLLLLSVLISFDASSQLDSIWNVMILKKGEQPEIRDTMATYSPRGFYLYRNCFYDLQLNDKEKKTLRLVEIRPDTLIFIGISAKIDTNLAQKSTDTFRINIFAIDKILLLKDWGTGSSKKIHSKKHHFIFYKSPSANRYVSQYASVFPAPTEKSELVPRLSNHGITYHFEYAGKLHYHSGIVPTTPTFSDEEKSETLEAVLTVLDFIINKRVTIRIRTTKKENTE